MPRTLEEIKEDIKSRLGIADVVGARITLKRSGSALKACCPFHNEKTPSFTVNEATGFYKCFGCGESGDIFSFLMKHDGMSFMDALHALAERAGVEVDLSGRGGGGAAAKRLLALHTEMTGFYRRCLMRMKSAAKARDYIASRGLPPEICEEFGVGYAPAQGGALEAFAAKHGFSIDEMIRGGFALAPSDGRGGALYDRFKGRLMFPIRDTQGRAVAFSGRFLGADPKAAKYVNSPETLIFKKGAILFALDKAQRHITRSAHREALICEGQIDVIRCHACGFRRAVASQGTAFTEEHARLLSRYADSATLVFDQDGAGRKAAAKTGALLCACGFPVRVALMPEGDDPDSFLRKNPPEAFQKILDGALDIVPFLVGYHRAQEDDPASEGAVGRIAKQTLETIAGTADEIRKARMLQQLSELISIPVAALQAGLQNIAEAQARRAAARAGRMEAPPQTQTPPPQAPPAPMAESARRHAPPKQKRIDPLELDLCELAFHSFANDRETAAFAAAHIPAALFENARCRAVYRACLDDCDETKNSGALKKLQATSREMDEFIGKLASGPDKTTGRESFTPADAAREFALRIWRRHCLARATAAPAASPERLRLRVDAKKLEKWESGASVITHLLGVAPPALAQTQETPEPAAEPLPKAESDQSGDAESGNGAEDLMPDFGDDYNEA